MEEVKISELPEATNVNDEDLLMIVQGGYNKKVSKEVLERDLQEQVNDKNVITVGITSNISVSTAGTNDINLNKIISSVGNKLTLSSGKIVIGEGVDHVLISGQGQMNITTGNGDAKNFYIQKNNTVIISNLNTIIRSYALNVSRAIGGFLVDVSQGDTISYQVYAGVGDSITTGNYITVEVID